jgi:DNA polymerase-3 subunit epsilon
MDFGLVLDVETTGIDPLKDKIIEIGIMEFAVAGDQPPQVTRSYGSLQDPGQPIPPEITKLTGLTDGLVKGHQIDWKLVRDLMGNASVIIAHNAEFDRKFVQASGQVSDLHSHWACSMRHVDWRRHGFRQLGLTYLAADHGFLNPFAHRALFDCATTFRLVSPYLPELVARSFEKEFTIRAVSSPFESKDVLKKRGYYWDQETRCWTIIVPESKIEGERSFLAEEVYKGLSKHREIPIENSF